MKRILNGIFGIIFKLFYIFITKGQMSRGTKTAMKIPAPDPSPETCPIHENKRHAGREPVRRAAVNRENLIPESPARIDTISGSIGSILLMITAYPPH